MVSTYTTNLRLTKQGDGDNPNSWGQILNDQVIDLVDNAVAGWVKISVGTVSTVVLTEYSGAEDQSRKQVLEIIGSVGDTFDTINVQIPATPKSYIVRTSMSYHDGAASNRVILKNAAGTGVSLTGGAGDATTAWFVTDGTTVVPVAQTNFGNINVGNVSVSGERGRVVERTKVGPTYEYKVERYNGEIVDKVEPQMRKADNSDIQARIEGNKIYIDSVIEKIDRKKQTNIDDLVQQKTTLEEAVVKAKTEKEIADLDAQITQINKEIDRAERIEKDNYQTKEDGFTSYERTYEKNKSSKDGDNWGIPNDPPPSGATKDGWKDLYNNNKENV